MKLILSKIPLVVLGIFLGIAGPAIAASVYSAGSLLQVGDVKSIHILNGTILNEDVSNSAAITYSKLNLSASIRDADVVGNAAISILKLAGGTPAGLIPLTNGTQLATTSNLSYATSTDKLSITGQLSVTASTTFNGKEYLMPSVEGASSTALMTNGAGHLMWGSPTVATSFPTFQKLTNTATSTYTTPANVLELYIRMCGGGAGGGVGGGGGTNATTTFWGSGTATTTAVGGSGGGSFVGGLGGTGGLSNIGTIVYRVNGGSGNSTRNSTADLIGSQGGQTVFGGAGPGIGTDNTRGSDAAPNSCAGGGSGTHTAVSNGSGGAGEYVEFVISNPAASYFYRVGGGGAGNTETISGGNGADGVIIVEEFYH